MPQNDLRSSISKKWPLRIAGILLLLGWGWTLQARTSGFVLKDGVRSVSIPVEIQNNVILLPVRINGSFEMNFILDTGVKTTIFTEPVVLSWLEIDSLAPVKIRGLGEGNDIDASLARNIRLSIPGAEGYGVNMVVLPQDLVSYSAMFGKPVYGIIGYEVFGQFVVEINYLQKYIRLTDPFLFKAPRSPKWTEVPINVRKGKPYVEASLIDHLGNKVKERWLMDTGASMAISLFHDELPVPDKSIPAFLGMGLSGNVYGKLGRNPTFSLGDFDFAGIVTGYPTAESLTMFPDSLDWYGNIGSEVLSRFRIIFDYHRQRVFLRKNRNFKKTFGYNISGLEFISTGDRYEKFIISYIRPGSPAEVAGLHIYDEILAMNGVPVSGQSIEVLYSLLSRRSGKYVRMKIKRGEKIIRLHFRLNEQI